jgi:prepilin-type N-terminal cleavage/methylation domain-containing protein
MNNRKLGFTLVEIMIGCAVFGLLLVFLLPIFSYSKRAGATMNRLDSYHDIRRVDQEVSTELKLGSGILFPPKPDGAGESEWYNQLIFRNSINQIQLIYVDESDKLMLLNYDKLKGSYLAGGRRLGSNIKEFSVRRHGNSVVEYKMIYEVEKRNFTTTNRISLLNVF